MVKRSMTLLAFALILAVLVSPFAIVNSQVDSTTNYNVGSTVGTTGFRDLWEAYQQKSFYANGRFWVFYYNGTNHDHEVYSSSSDGSTWSPPRLAVSETIDASHSYSVWFDGTYVHNVASCGWGTTIIYERGIPNSNGIISWQPEQTVIGTIGDFTVNYFYVYVAVDSNGYPWVTYEKLDPHNNVVFPYVAKSATNDGTWITANSFPYKLSNVTSSTGWGQSVVPLASGKILALSVSSGHAYAQAWDGAMWLPEVEINARMQGDQYAYFAWSAVGRGDYVDMVYSTASVNYGIGYEQYNYASNSFSSEKIVDQSHLEQWGYTHTLLSLDTQTDTLYCTYINPNSYSSNDTSYHQIVFKKYVNGVWDTDPTVFVNTTSPISSPLSDSSFFYTYGRYLGVMYNVGVPDSLTFNVTFAFLNVNQVPTSSTSPTLTPTSIPTPVPTSSWLSPTYILIGIVFTASIIGFAFTSIKNRGKKS